MPDADDTSTQDTSTQDTSTQDTSTQDTSTQGTSSVGHVEPPRRGVIVAGLVVAGSLAAYYLVWHIWLMARPLQPLGEGTGRLLLEYPRPVILGTLIPIPAAVILAAFLRRPIRDHRPAVVHPFAVPWGMGSITLTGLLSPVLPSDTFDAVVPFLEDFWKAVGVVLVALVVPSAIRGPVSGAVVGWLVGVGYTLIENMQYTINFLLTPPEDGAVLPTTARLVVGLLTGGHATYAGLAGVAIGLGVARGRRWLVPAAAAGLAVGNALHYAYNEVPLVGIPLSIVVTVAMVVLVRRAHRRGMP